CLPTLTTYPAGIAEDVFVQEGRPFLSTARALVDVYGEELILRDRDENLIFHADSTSKHPHKHGNESINMINFIDITCKDHFEEMLKIKKSNHPFSGSTTSPSDSSLSLTPFKTNSSPTNDIDIIDPIIERFTDELALIYSSPPGDDDDDLFDFKSDNDEWKKLLYGDPFNDTHSKNDKTKDSKIKSLIDELESRESNVLLPQLLEYDLTLHEELLEIDTLPSFPSENEDKVFNPRILVYRSTHFVTNEVTQDKNLKDKTSSEARLILENSKFLPLSSVRELHFHLELYVTETLLSFSSENEDKVFNPRILISKGVHFFTLGLSHRTYEIFKIVNVHPNILNESLMKIFLFFCSCPKDKGIRGESS
ncbi:hypothetical protein Tco_0466523, partial [Tanacetum coccineum]